MFEKIPHNTSRCDNGEKDGFVYAGDTWYDHNVSGYALSKADAKIYAKQHGLVFVEGPEVMKR